MFFLVQRPGELVAWHLFIMLTKMNSNCWSSKSCGRVPGKHTATISIKGSLSKESTVQPTSFLKIQGLVCKVIRVNMDNKKVSHWRTIFNITVHGKIKTPTEAASPKTNQNFVTCLGISLVAIIWPDILARLEKNQKSSWFIFIPSLLHVQGTTATDRRVT